MKLIYNSNKENAIAVVTALIKKLNVRVSPSTIRTSLQDHPNYPSLLAISDCLTDWKIPNSAYHINKNEYNSVDLSFPLIVNLQKEGQFILINTISNGVVTYSNESKTNATMSEQDFLSQWTGVILYGEATSESGEKEYSTNRFTGILNRLRIPALVTAIFIGIFCVFFQHNITWFFSALSLLTLIGIIVCILLLMYSMNANNPFVQNLCSLGKKNNCNAILKSKETKVTDWLNWSEVGFFYFSGSLISLLLVNNAVPFLAIFNLCCLPYTIWSVWYQYKAKSWCLLCCTVQALLWLEFIVFATGVGYIIPALETVTVVAMIFCFLIPIVVWVFVKMFIMSLI